jgi:hypothetical protein
MTPTAASEGQIPGCNGDALSRLRCSAAPRDRLHIVTLLDNGVKWPNTMTTLIGWGDWLQKKRSDARKARLRAPWIVLCRQILCSLSDI